MPAEESKLPTPEQIKAMVDDDLFSPGAWLVPGSPEWEEAEAAESEVVFYKKGSEEE